MLSWLILSSYTHQQKYELAEEKLRLVLSKLKYVDFFYWENYISKGWYMILIINVT